MVEEAVYFLEKDSPDTKDLSGTQVQGTLFVGWRGRLKDLTRLNLREAWRRWEVWDR